MKCSLYGAAGAYVNLDISTFRSSEGLSVKVSVCNFLPSGGLIAYKALVVRFFSPLEGRADTVK